VEMMDTPKQACGCEGGEAERIGLWSRQFRPALHRFFGKRVKERHGSTSRYGTC